jgi:GNAT superfamily N-acetyltransferase
MRRLHRLVGWCGPAFPSSGRSGSIRRIVGAVMRALLDAFVEEARGRGARRIWLASYDFQAPGMYEKAGFRRMAEFEGWPEGHVNVVLCKTL